MFHVSKNIRETNFMFNRSFNPIFSNVRINISKPGPDIWWQKRRGSGLKYGRTESYISAVCSKKSIRWSYSSRMSWLMQTFLNLFWLCNALLLVLPQQNFSNHISLPERDLWFKTWLTSSATSNSTLKSYYRWFCLVLYLLFSNLISS